MRSLRYVSYAVRVIRVVVNAARQPAARREGVAVPVETIPSPAVTPEATQPLTAHAPEAEELGIHLPAPSIWPVVLALGITLLLFGVVTDYIFSALGGLMIAGSLGGWIGELRHE